MNCEKIKELLKTDYIDNEISAKEKEIIINHISSCRECAKLEKDLQTQRAIWHGSKRTDVPKHIWQNIQNRIYEENLSAQKNKYLKIFEYFKELFTVKRPAIAFASSFAAILVVIFFTHNLIINKPTSYNDAEKTISAMSELTSENGYMIYNLGTDVEEYFLAKNFSRI